MTETTTEKPTVIEALLAAMADVQAVGKAGHNKEFNYSFRGIDATVNAVGPAFRKHGVIVMPVNTEARYRDVQTSRGKPSRECTVTVTYRFYGPAGDHIDAVVPGESMDSGDKGTAKAMSVAYRIVLLQALCIPTDEADPDSQGYERANHQATSQWETSAPEPVTDVEWANGLIKRITDVSSVGVLRGLYEEMDVKYRAGEVATGDQVKFVALFAHRKAELEGKPA